MEENTFIFFVILWWTIYTIIGGWIGSRKDRTVIGATLGFLFGFFGWAITTFWVKDLRARCPTCLSVMQIGAIKCPYCQQTFDLPARALESQIKVEPKHCMPIAVYILGIIIIWIFWIPGLILIFASAGLVWLFDYNETSKTTMQTNNMIESKLPTCPACKAKANVDATKCCHCGSDLVAVVAEIVVENPKQDTIHRPVWRCNGIERESGNDTSTIVFACDKEEAIQVANKNGVLVKDVTRLEPSPPSQ